MFYQYILFLDHFIFMCLIFYFNLYVRLKKRSIRTLFSASGKPPNILCALKRSVNFLARRHTAHLLEMLLGCLRQYLVHFAIAGSIPFTAAPLGVRLCDVSLRDGGCEELNIEYLSPVVVYLLTARLHRADHIDHYARHSTEYRHMLSICHDRTA